MENIEGLGNSRDKKPDKKTPWYAKPVKAQLKEKQPPVRQNKGPRKSKVIDFNFDQDLLVVVGCEISPV